jgi:hypothetical protein
MPQVYIKVEKYNKIVQMKHDVTEFVDKALDKVLSNDHKNPE